MPIYRRGPEPVPELETQRRVDARQLWSGGVATAVVAGLIALVGILICRWLFKIPILSPRQDGAWGDASTAGYVFASAACALAATGLMHLLLLATPRPRMFFGFIMALAFERLNSARDLLSLAGARHLSHIYNHIRHSSRRTRLPQKPQPPLKFKVIFCVRGVISPLLAESLSPSPSIRHLR